MNRSDRSAHTEPAGEYDTAVAVEQIGEHRWRGEVAEGWEVGGVTNGGYVVGIAVEAALGELGLPDPLTLTAHFLAPAEHGPVDIEVEMVRRGRSHGTALARIVQGDRDVLQLLTTACDLARASGTDRVTLDAPELPEPSKCSTLEEVGGFIERSISEKIHMRFHPDHLGFIHGAPNGEARLAGWTRFADGREPDVRSFPVFLDSFPPSTVNLELDVERAPTLELTLHTLARPAPGWLRSVTTTDVIAGGYIVEDAELWDQRGVLVAQSRQLALGPRG